MVKQIQTILFAVFISFLIGGCNQKTQQPPNILFGIANDWGWLDR